MKGMRMPSPHSVNRFSQVPRADIPRSQFDRSHGYKTTFDAGYLVPIFVDEALPGDTFNVKVNAFARLATPVKPIMDNLYLDVFFFAVPYRLVWTNWEHFNGGLDDPGDLGTDYTIPTQTVPAGGFDVGTLEDYFGIPTDIAGSVTSWQPSALPRRAYLRIYNEWFRDQNLIDSETVSYGDGPDTTPAGGTPLLKRGKRHDYFTSCLPWPQKGDAVELPLGSTVYPEPVTAGAYPTFKAATGDAADMYLKANAGGTNVDVYSTGGTGTWSTEPLRWDDPALVVDLSTATAATINSLRQAFQIQRLLERDARGGTRYTEIVKSHFGVTSPDARLQRTEYLGGGSAMVTVNPVAQQSSTDATTPQGNLSGIGTSMLMGKGFVKSFTEHCILIGLACVRQDQTYQQGLDRMWTRSTRYDFFWPALAHLGEQAVYNREIYLADHANDAAVFGYQERYAEYRYKPSRVTGKFRSTASGTLEVWHLAQHFGALPTLGQTFIEESPDMTRIKAVSAEPDFLLDAWFDMKCARPMPVYSVPGLIDHF